MTVRVRVPAAGAASSIGCLCLPETAGVYYFRRVNGVLKAQTLTSTAVVDSAAVALGSTGKPVVLYTAAGGVQKGVYYAKRL